MVQLLAMLFAALVALSLRACTAFDKRCLHKHYERMITLSLLHSRPPAGSIIAGIPWLAVFLIQG